MVTIVVVLFAMLSIFGQAGVIPVVDVSACSLYIIMC